MRGAIAAGHHLTAEAGARALSSGGNAVDACIAAGFTSWVVESPLSGPGAGGFMLVHRARDRSARLLDFFVSVPGLGRTHARRAAMETIDVDFGGESSQIFHIGGASCAVPGAVAGLEAAHRAYAKLPWRRLVEPAVRLARDGFELSPQQAYLHGLLDVILRHTAEGRSAYGGDDGPLRAGDRVVFPELAGTLEAIAEDGAAAFYRGPLGRRIVEFLREKGGLVTRRDLAEYRVVWRRPVRTPYRGHEFLSNPPPSSGGILIGYGLRLLEALDGDAGAGSPEALSLLVEVMREQSRAREGRFASDLYRGGLQARLCSAEAVAEALRRIRSAQQSCPEPAGAPGTTHISVVDSGGNAASMTASCGSGSGVIVPGTGVHLNNMLGERDLNPPGRDPRPGVRLTSMMAPSIVLRGGRPRLVVGSAGSVRLRGAILQIVVNVLARGLSVEEAIGRPRVHVDGPQVHCEGGFDPEQVDRLEKRGYDVVRWRSRNLYFGGAAAVEGLADGTLAAAGDPRRGGHGVVVE